MPWRCMGSGCIDLCIFHLDTIWWAVSFTPRSLYPGGIDPGTRWIGGCMGNGTFLDGLKKRTILPLPEFELRPLCLPARSQSLYAITTELSPLNSYQCILIISPSSGEEIVLFYGTWIRLEPPKPITSKMNSIHTATGTSRRPGLLFPLICT
jgi:hypothetical protein